MNDQYKERLERIIDIQEELDVRKKLYDEYDKLVVALQADGFIEAIIDGKELKLVDNYAEKNVCWRMAAIKRYELKIKKAK